MEYYTAINNDEITQFMKLMELEDIMLSKVSQKKDKSRMLSLICGI